MKRVLIICFLFIAGASSANCAATVFQPLQPINQADDSIQNYSSNVTSLADPFAKSATTNYSDINRIEQSLFGKTYDGQGISTRLSRIEKSLFTTTYPNASDSQRIDNVISNFNQINKYPNISKGALSKMESRFFSQNFPQVSPQRRIERLEQQVFGATQSGDINSRYEALKMATKNYNRNMNNNAYDSNNPNNVTQTGWKGITGNSGNSFFGGSMTGFTPPINPYSGSSYNTYNSYANPYPASGYGMNRRNGVNRGLNGFSYNDSSTDYGTGSGVTILD
jgi:hypothetical protein